MTIPHGDNQPQEQKPTDKELNFRALEQKYQQQLAAERAERERLSKELEQRNNNTSYDDDEDSEPYIDHKRLKKEQAKFSQQIKQETQTEIQRAVQKALQEERQQNWMKNNSDYYDVMEHAEKFAQADPELAETILQMPDNFERKKLVYQTIKSRGLHKPAEKIPSIQEKIDANRRAPYYQPNNIGSAPYSTASDFSISGQKQAYEKMQALKSKYGM